MGKASLSGAAGVLGSFLAIDRLDDKDERLRAAVHIEEHKSTYQSPRRAL